MKDFISRGTGNSRFLKSSIDQDTTFEQLVEMLRSGTFPIDFNGVNAAGVDQRGTPINKATLLTDDTADAIGLPSDDSARTVDKALMALLNVGAKNLHYVEYLKSANWVAPENITGNAIVICVGGGGGGECQYGSGGGSGYIEIESIELSPGETYRIVIGAGGAGGEPSYIAGAGQNSHTVPATPGGDGGTTSFGDILSAGGGKGGNWSSGASRGGNGEAGGGAGGTASAVAGRNGGNGRIYGGGGGAGFGGGKGGNGGTYGAGGGVAYQSIGTKFPGSTLGSSGSMAGQPFSDNALMYGPHASEILVAGMDGFGGKNGTIVDGSFATAGFGGGGYGANGGNTSYRYYGGGGGGGFGGKGGNGSACGGGGGGGFFGAGGDGQVDKNGGNGSRGGGGGGTKKDAGTGTYTGGNGGSGVCAIIYSTRGD